MRDMHQKAVPLRDRKVLEEVIHQGEELSKGSWEISALLQARLELDDTQLTPFDPSKTFKPPSSLTALPQHLIKTALDVISARPTAEEFPAGKGKVLCRDDAAGDPASLGIACILYGIAESEDVRAGRKSEEQVKRVKGVSILEAVRLEALFLEQDACRSEDGAISHRLNHLSLWADFVYMVPPFLYLPKRRNRPSTSKLPTINADCTGSICRKSNGLWKHIILGPDKIDPWPWATSNGWAAAGMLRVFATMRKADEAAIGVFQSQMADLAGWAREIVEAASKNADADGMIREYIDEPDFEGESCGTALLAYSAYRLAQFGITQNLIPFAERARLAVYRHIRPDGRLDKVCDIVDERKWRESSAEGQAFVILLEAAARDYLKTVEKAT